jgi:hypothetical protein
MYFAEDANNEVSKEKTLLFLDVPNDDFDHKKLFNLINYTYYDFNFFLYSLK